MLRALMRLFRRGDVDCQDVQDLSSAYLENDLTEVKRSAVQTHLSKCGPCRAFVDTLASTIGILTRLPGLSARPSLRQSIMERVRNDK